MIVNLARHPEAYVTTGDLAAYLVVSEHVIYSLIDKGALPVIRVGRLIRIPLAEACMLAGIYSDHE